MTKFLVYKYTFSFRFNFFELQKPILRANRDARNTQLHDHTETIFFESCTQRKYIPPLGVFV